VLLSALEWSRSVKCVNIYPTCSVYHMSTSFLEFNGKTQMSLRSFAHVCARLYTRYYHCSIITRPMFKVGMNVSLVFSQSWPRSVLEHRWNKDLLKQHFNILTFFFNFFQSPLVFLLSYK
jgi:hypothetical protein